MEKEKLEKLLQNLVSLKQETETVEFKENNFNKEMIGERISALANSANLLEKKRAYIVFGVVDKTHEITGTKFSPNLQN